MAEAGPSVSDVADRYFEDGYNCAQSVLRAVAEAAGVPCPTCIPAVALAMGGGVGHMGKTCGALTGAVMALGLAADRDVHGTIVEKKAAANRLAGQLVKDFGVAFGSPDCAAILGLNWQEADAANRFQQENAKVLKCTPCVRWAAAEALRLIDGVRDGG